LNIFVVNIEIFFKKEDLTWLKHEKAEQWYEQKHAAGYSESHKKVEKQSSWSRRWS